MDLGGGNPILFGGLPISGSRSCPSQPRCESRSFVQVTRDCDMEQITFPAKRWLKNPEAQASSAPSQNGKFTSGARHFPTADCFLKAIVTILTTLAWVSLKAEGRLLLRRGESWREKTNHAPENLKVLKGSKSCW